VIHLRFFLQKGADRLFNVPIRIIATIYQDSRLAAKMAGKGSLLIR